MPNISFQSGYAGSLLALLLVVSAALVMFAYRRSYAPLGQRRWLTLCGLRIAAIVAIVILLFRPVFTFPREISERPTVLFLIDQSSSMSIRDDASGARRFDQARDFLLRGWSRLKNDFDLRALVFSETAQALESIDELAEKEPAGLATSISKVLLAAPKSAPTRNNIEAVFLLSDGIHNAVDDPREACDRLGAAVLTVGVGNSLRDSRSHRDIQVTALETPDQLAVNNRARLKGYIDAIGLPGRVVRAEFAEDDRPLGETELVLDDVDGPQEVMIEFVPEKKGLHTYRIRISPIAEEKIIENNQQQTTALVVDSRIRVLYVEGTLRAEYGAVVGRFLAKDPDLDFCALVQTRPNVFTQRTNIDGLALKAIPSDREQLEVFDVILLGDLDSTYLKPEQMQLFADRVREGAGLLMMGGYHSLGPGGYGKTPVEEVLPVVVGLRDVGQMTDPFLPVLTPDGRNHPILTNIVDFFPAGDRPAAVEGLPPLEGCVRVERAKPGATVLAIHPDSAGQDRAALPVLAVQTIGKGRTAVFTGDTTRNWQQALRVQDRQSPFLRFWGQTIRWLAGREDEFQSDASIRATTDKAYYEPGATIAISAVVRGEEGEGLDRAKVSAQIEGPQGEQTTLSLAPVPGPAGHYRVLHKPEQSGNYQIQVVARLDDGELNAEPMTVGIGRPNLEFERLDLNEKLLIEIAEQTGGRYTHITTADRLFDRLKQRQNRRHIDTEVRLAWPPLVWVFFVAVLSTEWILRRGYQMR